MHEHIKSIAKEAGVNYVEGLDEPDVEKQARERQAIRARVSEGLADTPQDERDAGIEKLVFDSHSIRCARQS